MNARRLRFAALVVLAACHENAVLFEDDDGAATPECQVCTSGDCLPAADGTPCATGACEAGVCVASRCGGESWITIAAGGAHSCVVGLSGRVSCWGRNLEGQLGLGDLGGHTMPAPVSDLDALSVTAGSAFTCAPARTGLAFCWGENVDGQLGAGAVSGPAPWPQRVDGGLAWRLVDAGSDHACGITDAGGIACWGKNMDGALGVSAPADAPAPVVVDGSTDRGWRSLSAGGHHSCAIDLDAHLFCWGRNAEGQLGTGDLTARTAPVEVGAGASWAQVSAGATHTCAVETSGALSCWGDNHDGAVGTGEAGDRVTAPAPIGPGWDEVSLGERFGCAIRQEGTLWCWGKNDMGQLGLEGAGAPVPAQVGRVSDWLTVSAGRRHVCALRTLGLVYCWGDDAEGQLGPGDLVDRRQPEEVCVGDGIE